MTKSNFSCIVFQTRLKCGHMWQIILVKNLIFFCIKEYRINQYLLLVVVKLPFIEFVMKVFSWFYQFLSIIYIPKNQSPMLITLSIVPKLVRIAAISIFSEKIKCDGMKEKSSKRVYFSLCCTIFPFFIPRYVTIFTFRFVNFILLYIKYTYVLVRILRNTHIL